MSHVVTMELVIDDLNSLSKACKALGCELIRDKKTYEWWGRHVGDYPLPEGFTKEEMGKCEHAIKVPGANWEIGVVKNKEGKGFKLIYDFYGHEGKQIHKACGNNLGKLKQKYTVENLKSKIGQKAKVKEEQKDGKIKLTIRLKG